MNQPSMLARNLYIAALTPMMIGGLVYAVAWEFMPYHAEAVQRAWSDVDAPMQVLLISTLNACGSLLLCVTLAIIFLLSIPFRRGELWASWAMTSLGIASMLAVIRSALHVDLQTAANPPWPLLLVIIGLFLAALLASLRAARSA